MTRFEILFTIRYAVRVLERSSRFWGKVDVAIKICALLAGSGAIFSIASQNQAISLVFGVVFAITQAIEFSIRPAEKSAKAMSARAPYANLLFFESACDEAALERAYAEIAAADDVLVMEGLRKIAYNDVLEERSECAESAYRLSVWHRLLGWLA